MTVSNSTRLEDLASELGFEGRELVAKLADHGKTYTPFSRLQQAEVEEIRKLFRPRVTRTRERLPTREAADGNTTVVRRRARRGAEDLAPEPAAAEAPAAAATADTTRPVRRVAGARTPSSTTTPVATDRPRLRRASVDDLAMPPELQPRTMISTDEQIAAAAAVIAAEHAAEAAARAASDAAAAEAAAAAGEAVAEVVEQAVVEVATEARAEAAEVAPEPAPVAPANVEAVAVEASPAEAMVVVEEEVSELDVDVTEIGKALDNSEPLPSQRKVPRLIRTKMPEVLVNIPKPAPRPVSTATPAESGTAAAAPARFGAPATSTEDDRRGRRGASASNTGRGRKLIYDRHRDGVSADDRRRGRKRTKNKAATQTTQLTVPKAEKRIIRIEDTITVSNLAHQMSVKATEVIKKLFELGIMATINHTLDLDTVELVSGEFGFTVENVAFDLETYLNAPEGQTTEQLESRPPVITVMGHVDHGKTTLLDRIRKARVAAREAGGITQHIGAYKVRTPQGRDVVFLDTPGHEAFTSMRARGAKATDVVVLVVAADDGVMPQTIEAINHARAAEVPIIVAINKIDKDGADVERVRRELAEQNLVVEEWGGDVTAVEVSAKQGLGIEDLLETLALQSEVMDLRADAACDARGLIVEARLERGRGAVATLLVQQGTLKKGDVVVAGQVYGRVRAMADDAGEQLNEAGPSTPIEIIGLNGIASAGEEFYVTPDEKSAKAIVDHRITKAKEKHAAQTSKVSLDQMFEHMEASQLKELNVIIKADVHGSAEALKGSLTRIATEDVRVRVLHAAVGGVTESDIQLAAASKAMILAFNVKPEAKGKRLAEDLGVEILPFSVIYEAIDTVMAALEGLLEPIVEEIEHGSAEVRAIFHIAKTGSVAGCYVTDGKMLRNGNYRLRRDGEVLWTGRCTTLKRFKDDVSDVGTGYECGISLDGFGKFREGDTIECFELKKTPRKLDIERAYRPAGEDA
ncbi:MAG: translation initiation factor IF-2 [Deltaproteobacteria bacterium]|nr:translation initiation factor IF-2 [Deltaproteobacteria bacterium]